MYVRCRGEQTDTTCVPLVESGSQGCRHAGLRTLLADEAYKKRLAALQDIPAASGALHHALLRSDRSAHQQKYRLCMDACVLICLLIFFLYIYKCLQRSMLAYTAQVLE